VKGRRRPTKNNWPVFWDLRGVFGVFEVSPLLAFGLAALDPRTVIAAKFLQLMETIFGRINPTFLEMRIQSLKQKHYG
jgi:hypothetical protein